MKIKFLLAIFFAGSACAYADPIIVAPKREKDSLIEYNKNTIKFPAKKKVGSLTGTSTSLDKCIAALVPPYATPSFRPHMVKIKLKMDEKDGSNRNYFGELDYESVAGLEIERLRELIRSVNPTYRSNRTSISQSAANLHDDFVVIFELNDGKATWFPKDNKHDLMSPDAYKARLHACDGIPELKTDVEWQLALLDKNDDEVVNNPEYSKIEGDIFKGVKYPAPPATSLKSFKEKFREKANSVGH